jgi:hypothetical protein
MVENGITWEIITPSLIIISLGLIALLFKSIRHKKEILKNINSNVYKREYSKKIIKTQNLSKSHRLHGTSI